MKNMCSSDYKVNVSLWPRIVNLADEAIKRWENVRNEELHNLYSSSIYIGMNKLVRKKWVAYVTRMEKLKINTEVLVGKLRKRPAGKEPQTYVGWWENCVWGYILDKSASGQSIVAGCCWHCNGFSDSMKGGKSLSQLRYCQHPWDFPPCS